jgi:hypothetical protein
VKTSVFQQTRCLIIFFPVGPALKFSLNNGNNNLNVNEYERVSMQCNVKGYPTPNIELYHNGYALGEVSRYSDPSKFENGIKLVYDSVGRNANGSYACKVESNEIEMTYDLTVYCEYLIVKCFRDFFF